ncbi:MAG: phasin [Phyllobacteriaceae bacterium]|nr:phasin [Phyllobacteriaceae bacterium]
MTTQAKTPTKRTTKAATAAKPEEVTAAAPAPETTIAPTETVAEPVAAPVVEAPVAPAPVAAAPVAPAEAPAAASPFAGFEFPKFEVPGFELPKFDLPKFDLSKFELPKLGDAEIPAVLRGLAEKAVTQAKSNYEKMKAVAEEATDAIEDSYETARAGVIQYGNKTIDAAKANSDATLGHAKDLLGVKTFAEAIELQTSFVRQQYETLSAQAKELQEMATKLAGEAAKPVKDVFEKSIDVLKKD